MTRIILSTGNIVLDGPSIIRKPGASRSNLEFTNSLRNNFLAAQQDYAGVLQNGNGHTKENGQSNRPAPEVWTEKDDSTLYVPRIDWLSAGLQEDRAQYEITVKLFFLPTASPEKRLDYIREALRLVAKELGVDDVDLLIVSFPGISFEGDCEWEADKKNATMGNEEEEIATWGLLETLHQQGLIQKLGIAEFGTEKLRRFLDQVNIRPAVDQINIKNCCNVPPPLAKLAKEKRIELFTHHDSPDVLPSGTLRELLGQGPQGAGVLADHENNSDGLKGEIFPEWVVKYTAFVKNRGVIENKGYFASAELLDED
ncbi:NADP-dependent oxidoreductase domain-containing protein [Hypoxylon fragiforme]|uniref:NADP-dependent oxidoreductase domain-containing protein n=1 Tax=Hypoxylon fragiforme TaxID=63214 RepID=UPI0020C72DD5|nr:NADP-dependent oxidoreductase domain-containing protein [Hypoxylon fragiforme]KAI2606318.1 NADP-dependent oxidoreductase domain-containing protein [Hypoxylon fragiforme]